MSAFQAENGGSIPLTRSIINCQLRIVNYELFKMIKCLNAYMIYAKMFICFLIVCSFFYINQTTAEQIDAVQNNKYSIFLDQPTIQKGYTVNAFNSELKLSLMPEILNQSTTVQIERINHKMEMPLELNKISEIYQFEFINKKAYNNHKPFYIQFSYNEISNNYKQVFFYDKNYTAWRPLPTKDYLEQKFVRSLIHLPFARIAVFENPEILTTGQASWYKYKNGNFAASPDFSKGSILRVYNIENNKFIDVKINDYGPHRGLHPNRAIDLDKIAFSKIASLKTGIINVKIEPLFIK